MFVIYIHDDNIEYRGDVDCDEDNNDLQWVMFDETYPNHYYYADISDWLTDNCKDTTMQASLRLLDYFKITFQTEEDKTMFLLKWVPDTTLNISEIEHN